LPVLTTPTGDAARIVKDGATGFVLKPDDPQGMADCIVNLVRNPALANQMGEAGRKQVEQDYNITSLVPQLMAIFFDFASQYAKKSILKMLEHRHPLNSYATSRVSTHGLPLSAA
jgi:glycosyltransferase involved in cell wall biosynthesis